MRTLITLLLFLPGLTFAQFFTNVGPENGLNFTNPNANFGAGVSFFDFDKDGWDDLTFAMRQDSLKIFKNVEGSFVQMPSPLYCDADAKQVNWVDFDNDGDYDLFVTQYTGFSYLLENTPTGFVDISEAAGIPQFADAPTYGACWGDYDKDGHLDVYMCNYASSENHLNWLLHNNGDGTFEEVGQELGVQDGYNATFQACWMDYDNDGWPDLHIINDKIAPNALFRNNGNGTFTDVSESTGTDIVMDSMSTTVADYNNDGTLDIYITDEPPHNALLRNNAGLNFQDVAETAGVELNALSWGAVFLDYDNDLSDDLFVTTTWDPFDYENVFYVNTGSTFVDASFLGFTDDGHLSYGASKGDINNDGYPDLVVTNTSFDPQDLYLNPGGDNGFVKVSLEGTVSNTDATGTWLHSWIDGSEYVDWTMNGENFMAQESQYEIIPLGEAEALDSIFITWPSGIEEVYYDIPSGSFIHFIEGYTPEITISDDGGAICNGNSLTASVDQAFDSYLWSNEQTGQSTSITEAGEYWVSITYNGGLTATSGSVTYEVTQPAQLLVDTTHVSCYNSEDGMISISTLDIELDSILWNNNSTSFAINSLQPGDYAYLVADVQGCLIEDTVTVLEPDSLWAEAIVIDASCFGFDDGSVELIATGGTGEVDWFWDGVDPDMLGAMGYSIWGMDENECEVVADFVVGEPEGLLVELVLEHSLNNDGTAEATISGGTEPYDILWSTDEITSSIQDLSPGQYSIEVTDANDCVTEVDFEIEQIISVTEIEMSLDFYPNPTKGQITIESSDYQGIASFSAVDSAGREVSSGQINLPGQLDLSALEAGHYTLWLHTNTTSVGKLISIVR